MELNVVILAGGQSTRFWPLEEKNLFEFFGTPLIIYQIKRYSLFLKRNQITPNFVVVTNETNYETIKAHLVEFQLDKLQLVTQTLPNQSGAIAAALTKTKKNAPLLIINSNDIFSEILITDLLKKINGSQIVLTATEVKSYFPGGYLVKNNKGFISKIVEKPPQNTVPNQYNLFRFVLDFFPNKKMLEDVLNNNNQNLGYEDAINQLLAHHKAGMVINDQPFTSLKYPWHVLSATNIFLNTIKESTVNTEELDPTSQIVGKVFIAPNVKIGSFTKIIGPCYIGKNSIIGDHCLIRHSHIGQNCLIGANSEVARSYLGNNVKLHRNYIGDSILADDVSFGGQAITANWRFDEQTIKSMINNEKIDSNLFKLGCIAGSKVKVGVNTSIMPGVKIAKNSVVHPNTTVFNDII